MTTTLERPTTAPGGNRPGRRPAPTQNLPLLPVTGVLDVQDQHGFLRVDGYLPSAEDFYVPAALVRQYGLRSGDLIDGAAAQQPPAADKPRQAKAHPLARVDLINGRPAAQQRARPRF